MSKLLALLRRFLHLGVEGDGSDAGGGDPNGGAPEDLAPTEGDDFEALLANAEGDLGGDADPEPSRPAKSRRELELEAELATTRAQLSSRPTPPVAPVGPDPDTAREEAELAALQQRGASEEEIRWARWQVGIQRQSRETDRRAAQALSQAQDINDRTEFTTLASTNPKVYSKYQGRVEEFVQNLRRQGQSAPRLAVLRFLIGEDVLKNAGAKPKTPASRPATTVNRGAPAPIRSDARSTSAKSEREKRAARLDGVRL